MSEFGHCGAYRLTKTECITLECCCLCLDITCVWTHKGKLKFATFTVRLLSYFLQTAPVQIIYVEAGVVGLEKSLAHPDLFCAWGTTSSCVNFYNLRTGEIIPSLQLPAAEKPAIISTVRCNPHRCVALISTYPSFNSINN